MRILAVVMVSLFLASQGEAESGISRFEHLLHDIKEKSNTHLIPRNDPTKPLKVDFQAGLLNIEGVDYDTNTVDLLFWESISWNTSITWNPADYGGIDDLSMSSSDFYIPKVEITNFAGSTESWLSDLVFLRNNGMAIVENEVRGKVYCDNIESNSCRLRAGTGGSFNNVVSFLEPSKREYDLWETYKSYYFKGSHYRVTSHKYEIHKHKLPMMNNNFEYEYIDIVFSFEEKHGGHHEGPGKVVFKFY